jgi:hypothetical protein
MTKWVLGAIIVLGTILSLGLGLWATPVEVTTQDQLLFALDQACTKAGQLQTGSQVLCNQVKERLKEELQKQLQDHRSIKLDPDLLGEVLAWTAQWNRGDPSGMGVDEALQLALSLTEMLDQGAYGEKLHGLLAYGQAAGYTPEEMTVLVTQLAEMVTTQTPAGNVLDEALGHLDKALSGEGPEKVLEAIQQGINNIPGMPNQDASNSGNEEKMPSIEQSNGQPEKGPELGHQPPSDRGDAAEVSAPPTADEEEDEGVPQQERDHKKGQSGKGK